MQKQQKNKELQDYSGWRVKEEENLFRMLQRKQASPHDLALFNDSTRLLRKNQMIKTQQLAEAGHVLEKAEKNLVEARQNFIKANRKKIKIEEHKSRWKETQRFFEEQRQEKELEEHTIILGQDVLC